MSIKQITKSATSHSVKPNKPPVDPLLVNNQKKRNNNLTTGSTICSQKYVLSHNIGKGTFGQVYIGILAIDNKQKGMKLPKEVAIKVQNDSTGSSQLSNQIQILSTISNDPQLIPGFPQVYTSGSQGGNFFMVMQLLGPNIQDLMTLCGGIFTLKTSLLLAIQILQKIEFLHQKGYVYRDIKPENFVMGIEEKSSQLFMIDFGLCRPYKDPKTGLFIPYKENVPIVGTIRYAGLNSHLGIQQTRRDDLQAVLYMIVYFLKGQLPWQGLKKQDRFQKDHVIMQAKLKVSTKQLCSQLPFQIHNVFDYIKSLDFYQDPDYKYIMSQLSSLYQRMGFVLDFEYDWVTLNKNVSCNRGNLKVELKLVEEEQRADGSNASEISSAGSVGQLDEDELQVVEENKPQQPQAQIKRMKSSDKLLDASDQIDQ